MSFWTTVDSLLSKAKQHLQRSGFLYFVIPPVLLGLAAPLLGDWLTTSYLDCCPSYDAPPNDKVPVSYLWYVYGWASSLTVIVLIGFGGAAYAIRVMMYPAFAGGRKALTLALALVLLLLFLLVGLRFFAESGLRTETLQLLFEKTLETVTFADSDLNLRKKVLIVLAIFDFVWIPPAVFLALAAATCAAPSSPDTGPQGETLARQRQAFLETILYFAAGLLVAGLIAMHFLVNVPTAFYAKPPDNVSELARAIEFQLALTYSLILAGVYLPVVLALYWQQDGYAEKKSSMEEKKGAKQSFGTWLPVGSGLAHFIAILSPLLTDLVIRLLGIPMA